MASSRRASIELTADPRKMDPGLREAKSKLANFGRQVGRVTAASGLIVGKALAPVARGIGRIGAAAGAGLTGLFASQIDDAVDYERRIARLAIAQGKSNDQMEDYRRELVGISRETGLSRNELLKGSGAYQALTGDTNGAARATRTFARISQATGSGMEDVATAAASLAQNMQIDPGDFEKVFSVINVQGKAGSVELKDFAGEIASLSATWKQFKGGTGAGGVAELGAAFQTVRKDTGSSSEAATRLQALTVSIVRNAKKLKGKGVRVFDAKGNRRAFSEIIQDFRKANLSDVKLTEILGSAEALQALRAMTGHWSDFTGLVNTTDFESIGRDFDQYMVSPAGKLEQAWNNVKLAAASAITPERIEKAAQAMEQLANAVGLVAKAYGYLEEGATTVFGNDVRLLSPEQLGQYRGKDALQHQGDTGIFNTAIGQDSYVVDKGALQERLYADQARAAAPVIRRNQFDKQTAGRFVAPGSGEGAVAGTRAAAAAAPGAAITLQALERSFERAMQRSLTLKLGLQIGGAPVFDAVANAPQNRTRPGG